MNTSPVQDSIEDFYRRMLRGLMSGEDIFSPFACALVASSLAFSNLFEAELIDEHSLMYRGIVFVDDWLTGEISDPEALGHMTYNMQEAAKMALSTEIKEGLNSVIYLLLAGAQYQQDEQTGQLEVYHPQHFIKLLTKSTESAATVTTIVDGYSGQDFVSKWRNMCWEDHEQRRGGGPKLPPEP